MSESDKKDNSLATFNVGDVVKRIDGRNNATCRDEECVVTRVGGQHIDIESLDDGREYFCCNADYFTLVAKREDVFDPFMNAVKAISPVSLDLIREANNGSRGPDQQRIASIGLGLIELLLKKNADYGSSAWTRPVLAPGVSVRDAIACRMSDKIHRLQQLQRSGSAEVSESLEDTMRDLGGYAILWIGAEDDC